MRANTESLAHVAHVGNGIFCLSIYIYINDLRMRAKRAKRANHSVAQLFLARVKVSVYGILWRRWRFDPRRGHTHSVKFPTY